jgi:predicted esterase
MPPREAHIPVTRSARYCTLGEVGPAMREVWFVCHGYGQLAGRFLGHFSELDDGTRHIVAPEALSRFYLGDTTGPHGPEARVGATWMTREDRLREIDDYVGYLDAVYARTLAGGDRGRVRVTVLGFSQGTATVSRWLTRGSATADRLILWGGFLPGDMDVGVYAHRLRTLELTVVLGRHDEFVRPEAVAAARELLERHAIPYQLVTFDGGHRLDAAVLRALAVERGGATR